MSSCLVYDELEKSEQKLSVIANSGILSSVGLSLNDRYGIISMLEIYSKEHDNCFSEIISSLNDIVSKVEDCDKKVNTLSTGLENVITSYKKAEGYTGDLNEEKLLNSEDFRGGVSIFGNEKADQSISSGEVNPENLCTSKDEFDKSISDVEKQRLEDKQNSYIPIADRTKEESDLSEQETGEDEIIDSSTGGTATIMGSAIGGATTVLSTSSSSGSDTSKSESSKKKKKSKKNKNSSDAEETEEVENEEDEILEDTEEQDNNENAEEAARLDEEEARLEEERKKLEEEAKKSEEDANSDDSKTPDTSTSSDNQNETSSTPSQNTTPQETPSDNSTTPTPSHSLNQQGTASSGSDNYHSGGGYSSSDGYSDTVSTSLEGTDGITDVTESPIEVLDDAPTSIEDVIKDNYTKIPSSSEPITSSTSKGKGTIIPVIAGLSAAAAAGIGAKAYLDRKQNNENDEVEELETDDWSGEEKLDLEYDDNKVPVAYLDDDDDEEEDTMEEQQPERYDAKTNEELADLQ